jgi:hypothetical protein
MATKVMLIAKWCVSIAALGLLVTVLFAKSRSPYPRSVGFSAPHLSLGASLVERYWFTPTSNKTVTPIIDGLFPVVYACGKPKCPGTLTKRLKTDEDCTGESFPGYAGRTNCPHTTCVTTNKHKYCGASFNQDKYHGCYNCPWDEDHKCAAN